MQCIVVIMYRNLLILLALFALYLPACSSSSGSGGEDGNKDLQFTVNSPVYPNDLAFLFPLNADGRPQPFVSLASQQDIPGEGNFQEIVDTAQREGVFFSDVLEDPNNWAMVGFRYTPCEFFAGQDKPCKEHVRFIYQPMNVNVPGAGFLDFSMHVTYEFKESDAATPSSLMAAIYKLREAADGKTDGLPLQVHPVLLDRVDRAVYFNQIFNTVWKPFIFDRDPTAITFMGLGRNGNDVNQGEWRFLFGRVGSFGRWVHEELPDGSGEMVEVLSVDQQQGSPTAGNLFSNIDDNTEFNILTGGPVRESAAAGALVPQVSNEHNVNCASCHTADSQVIRDALARSFTDSSQSRLNTVNFSMDQFAQDIINFMGDESGFVSNLTSNEFRGGMFRTPDVPAVDPAFPPQEEVVTRMFGYMHAQPTISQRMSFDNGMAVNAMNKAIRMDQRFEEAGRTCSDFRQAFAAMTCLLDGDFNTSLDQCIAQSCQ